MKNPIRVFNVWRGDDVRDGVMTVATEVRGNKVRMGFAFTHSNDRFEKKVGATKAMGRLNSLYECFEDEFTGHSADSIVRVFNSGKLHNKTRTKSDKNGFVELNVLPQRWRHVTLANVEQAGGITVVEKVD